MHEDLSTAVMQVVKVSYRFCSSLAAVVQHASAKSNNCTQCNVHQVATVTLTFTSMVCRCKAGKSWFTHFLAPHTNSNEVCCRKSKVNEGGKTTCLLTRLDRISRTKPLRRGAAFRV